MGSELLGFLIVVSGVGQCLGWRDRCFLSDPSAVMASAPLFPWFLIVYCTDWMALLPWWFGAADLVILLTA